MEPHVLHNADLNRYEIWLGEEKIGHADYLDVDGVLHITHTEIDPAHQGKNYAAILVREALEDIEQTNSHKVWPVCPYVVKYMEKHPETQGLLSKPLN
ncbi:MAG: N-acetyltransferase [Actinobacteria bacterium]|nr:N-acetyltransferase [Actinomycetota bacterium]